MRHVNQVINNPQQKPMRPQATHISRVSGLPQPFLLAMRELWDMLGDTMGSAFLNQFGQVGSRAFETWCLGLQDLSSEQIREGFIRFMQDDSVYAPTLKAIRKHCLAAVVGDFPDTKLAYHEACRKSSEPQKQQWSHRVVYLAGRETGWFDLKARTEKEIFSTFARNYEVLCRRIANGENVEVALPKGLPEEVSGPALSKGENHKRMQNLIADMGL